MGSRREEERNEKIIRGLMKLPPNRKCINCNSVVTLSRIFGSLITKLIGRRLLFYFADRT
jgi:hypothetical protein